MKRSFKQILDLCLERLEKGVSLEEVVKDYPEHSDDLREMLLIAGSMRKIPGPEPSPQAMARCLSLVESLCDEYPDGEKNNFPVFFRFPRTVFNRLALSSAVVLLLATGAFSFSLESIPGEALYPVKKAGEKIHCCLSFTPEQKARAYLCCVRRRIREQEKIFSRKGHVDKDLFDCMFLSQNRSIQAIGLLPPWKRRKFCDHISEVIDYQREALENLSRKAAPAEQAEVLRALSLCLEQERKLQSCY